MTTSAMPVTSAAEASAPRPAGRAVSHDGGWTFHEILSALNPLQYLPVVGTIYRAATGDVIPEPLRRIGSLLVSGLLGGPIGIVTSIAMTIAEKITGIEPEKILAAQFHTGPPEAEAREVVPSATPRENVSSVAREVVPASSPGSVLSLNSAASPSLAMTPAQLAAYGVTVDALGELRLGNVVGADVLNTLELARHARATAAYAATQS